LTTTETFDFSVGANELLSLNGGLLGLGGAGLGGGGLCGFLSSLNAAQPTSGAFATVIPGIPPNASDPLLRSRNGSISATETFIIGVSSSGSLLASDSNPKSASRSPVISSYAVVSNGSLSSQFSRGSSSISTLFANERK
jgi:hypothetical protein